LPAFPIDRLRRHYGATDAELDELQARFEALPERMPEGEVSQQNATNINSSWPEEQLAELRPAKKK
jgi:hypothetical protein